MSAYQLQQYLFDRMRDPLVTPSSYVLTDEEQAAVEANDIARFYVLGVHPVLLNGWCRASGYTRDAYRELLAPLRSTDTDRRPRWRSS